MRLRWAMTGGVSRKASLKRGRGSGLGICWGVDSWGGGWGGGGGEKHLHVGRESGFVCEEKIRLISSRDRWCENGFSVYLHWDLKPKIYSRCAAIAVHIFKDLW